MVLMLAIALVLSAVDAPSVRSQTRPIVQMSAEERAAYFARLNAQSEEEWHRMIGLLKVKVPDSLPPPANDPNRPANTFQKSGSPNWYDKAGNFYVRTAWGTWNNYDEARANPYPVLPDPLLLPDGRRVRDPKTWWNVRRPQIESDFTREIFGDEPLNTPPVNWEVVRTVDTVIGTTPVVTQSLRGNIDNSIDTSIRVGIELTVTTPSHAAHPVPLILEFGFVLPPGYVPPGMPKQEGPTWQEQVLEENWAYAVYDPTSVQTDNAAGLSEGIIGLMNRGGRRSPQDWGALRAWAWGASRVLDYLESNARVDARKIGIEGVSRYGKAVLVTMAYDQRFAIALVGSSGKGGAVLYRRDFGESMGNICSSGEFHWFAGNFLRYVLAPNNLTVDSHELIDLCAPRPVFISCGSPEAEGRWVDDEGQFMAAAAAGPVYELLGEKGLARSTMPPIGTSLESGAVAFRQHEGGHTIGPNWPYFLNFAKRCFASSDSLFHK